jgi:ABC-type polysaccharide/polyol phosphate export permease
LSIASDRGLIAATPSKFYATIRKEVTEAFGRFYLAVYLAWSDTRTRYRRSVLGPFWLVLGTAIGVGGLGIVWGSLFEVDRAVFIPSLTVGLVCWYLLSGCVIESAGVFYHNRELLLSMPSSSLLISIQLLLRQVVNFGHNFVVVIIVLAIFPHALNWSSFLAIPGFLLVCVNMLWIIQLVGYFGARFRDLEPLLAAVMQPLFFVTPVMFRSSQLGAASMIVEFNPFTYWLGLIRDPLMGVAPSALTWGVSLGMAVVGWTAALYMTGTKRHRLPYWVH